MEGYQKFIAFNGMARYFFFRLGYAWTHEYVMLSLSIKGLLGFNPGPLLVNFTIALVRKAKL